MKKKVLISGGSKGIGRHLALHLAATGEYEVTTFARSPVSEALDHPQAALITHIPDIDVRDFAKLETLDLSGYDGLVNNVGIAYDGILATQGKENIEDLIHVNLTSVIYLTKLFIRSRLAKRQAGTIVNVSSIISLRGFSGLSVYSATKAGLNGFTRSIAREMGAKGFRINSVLPGYLETDISKDLRSEQKAQIIRRTPLGRLAQFDDLSPVIRFLLSNDSKFVTGQSLVVDGGGIV